MWQEIRIDNADFIDKCANAINRFMKIPGRENDASILAMYVIMLENELFSGEYQTDDADSVKRAEWIDPTEHMPHFDCMCWCAFSVTHSTYDYNTHELLHKCIENYEDIVEIKDGNFEMPELVDYTGCPRVIYCLNFNDFKRQSPYSFSAQKLDKGNNRKNWKTIEMCEIEIHGYTVLPEDFVSEENTEGES